MTEERWLPVTHAGFEHAYLISDHGRLKSLPRQKRNGWGSWTIEGKIISPGLHPYGYKVVCLKADGKKKMERIHRLVALAFIPNPLGLPCINHLDCDPANNHYTNLEWCDQTHNMNYAGKLGRFEGNQAKLTWEKVALLRKMRSEGHNLDHIASVFGVTKATVSHICLGRTWKI